MTTSTNLLALNGTPYRDTQTIAEGIFSYTLNNNGGTFDVTPGDPKTIARTDGYAVGGYQDTVTIKVEDDKKHRHAVRAIANFIQRIPSRPGGGKHFYLGTWIDDGVLYIDAVKILDSFQEAIAVAKKHGEDAIYNLGADITLYTADYVEHDGLFIHKDTKDLLDHRADAEIRRDEGEQGGEEVLVPLSRVTDILGVHIEACLGLAANFSESENARDFRNRAEAIDCVLDDFKERYGG